MCSYAFTHSFITEVLHLVTTVRCTFCSQYCITLVFSWQAFTTCCVTKAMPILFIDSKCHIRQLKSRKSCNTYSTNHTCLNHTISRNWLIMPSGRTHTHTHILTCEPKQFQEIRRAGHSLVHTWFKKLGIPSCSPSHDEYKYVSSFCI